MQHDSHGSDYRAIFEVKIKVFVDRYTQSNFSACDF